MDFSIIELDDEASAFQAEVRAFCDEHLTQAVHDEEWATGAGHNWSFHRALASRGWVLPTWPVDKGGAGLEPLRAAILEHELSSRHFPYISRATTTMVLAAVMQWGTDELKEEVLPGVAAGEILFCLGYTEPDVGSDLAAVRTRAVLDGDEWVIDGQKMFTTGAQNCQFSFLVTRTNPDAPKHKGITMFLCPLAGVEIRALHTLGGERTNMVFYDGIRISDRYRLGPVDEGWAVLSGPLSAEHGMGSRGEVSLERRGGMYGSAGAVAYDACVEWAHTPDDAGRRPIDDPVVRRRLADIALDLEVATATPGPMGRIVSSELLIKNSAAMIDLLGPVGLLPRGEPGAVGDGWVEYAHRFAQGTAIYGGTTDVHRNIVAEKILGLPRSTPSSRR